MLNALTWKPKSKLSNQYQTKSQISFIHPSISSTTSPLFQINFVKLLNYRLSCCKLRKQVLLYRAFCMWRRDRDVMQSFPFPFRFHGINQIENCFRNVLYGVICIFWLFLVNSNCWGCHARHQSYTNEIIENSKTKRFPCQLKWNLIKSLMSACLLQLDKLSSSEDRYFTHHRNVQLWSLYWILLYKLDQLLQSAVEMNVISLRMQGAEVKLRLTLNNLSNVEQHE